MVEGGKGDRGASEVLSPQESNLVSFKKIKKKKWTQRHAPSLLPRNQWIILSIERKKKKNYSCKKGIRLAHGM